MAKEEEEKTTTTTTTTPATPTEEGAAAAGGAEGGGDAPAAPAKEEESTAQFEPVVKLEEVETVSGEEEEEVLYSQRSKLFVYAETLLEKGTGNKTWNERGVGNIRILKHREHQRCRVLMRQEKTMKLLINHMLIPGLVLVPHATSDRAWVWRANDYADGELKETAFCIRFADTDIRDAFKETFEKYQKEMELLDQGADDTEPESQAAGEEAAEALGKLSTSDAPSANE